MEFKTWSVKVGINTCKQSTCMIKFTANVGEEKERQTAMHLHACMSAGAEANENLKKMDHRTISSTITKARDFFSVNICGTHVKLVKKERLMVVYSFRVGQNGTTWSKNMMMSSFK